MAKEILFSVTASDCRFDYYKGSGPGGQHRNKTASAVRCTHIASGAVGKEESSRSQHTNKRAAFVKMSQTKEFKAWHKIETAKRLGKYVGIDDVVDRQMRNLKVEHSVDGKWVDEKETTVGNQEDRDD